HPGPFREVVHEDVVALLRILPEVKDLRDGGDVFGPALPAKVGIDRETAGLYAVVAPQVEEELVVVPAYRTGREFVLGEIEPRFAGRLPRPEQDRRHIVAVEDHGLALAVLLRQLDAREGRKGCH